MGVLQSPLLRYVIVALLVIGFFAYFVNKNKSGGSKAETSSKKSERDMQVPQAWGLGVTHAAVTKVYVSVGDTIKQGDLLVELETGKAAIDVESEFTGRISSLYVEVGDEVSQGDALGTIESVQPMSK
jgi:biotin carboxyl carrier protein